MDETQAGNKTKIFNRYSINKDEHYKNGSDQNTKIFNDQADTTILIGHKGGYIDIEDTIQKRVNMTNLFETTMMELNT